MESKGRVSELDEEKSNVPVDRNRESKGYLLGPEKVEFYLSNIFYKFH